jgi:hypothetical protein
MVYDVKFLSSFHRQYPNCWNKTSAKSHKTAQGFCELTTECQEAWFKNFFVKRTEDPELRQTVLEHREPAMTWLAGAAGKIQALIPVEDSTTKLQEMLKDTNLNMSIAAHKEVTYILNLEHANKKSYESASLEEVCKRSEKVKSMTAFNASIWRFMGRDYVREFICTRLYWDFTCLGYTLDPEYCDGYMTHQTDTTRAADPYVNFKKSYNFDHRNPNQVQYG